MKTPIRILIGVALPVILIDQIVKYAVSTALPLGGAWSPLPGPDPFIQIIHTYNTGVAFGLFQNLSIIFTILPMNPPGPSLSISASDCQPPSGLVIAALSPLRKNCVVLSPKLIETQVKPSFSALPSVGPGRNWALSGTTTVDFQL